jgi:5'-3' exonuclease
MLKIEFVKGNMFADSKNMTDGFAFFGKNNMAFGLSSIHSGIAIPEGISDPFEIPFKPIPLRDGGTLFCILGEFMSDDDLQQAIARLFEIASEMGLRSMSMNGIRNSEKLQAESTAQAIQMDNKRVEFIVSTVKDWYQTNSSNTSISRVRLIAMSDNFTRNFQDPLFIE